MTCIRRSHPSKDLQGECSRQRKTGAGGGGGVRPKGGNKHDKSYKQTEAACGEGTGAGDEVGIQAPDPGGGAEGEGPFTSTVIHLFSEWPFSHPGWPLCFSLWPHQCPFLLEGPLETPHVSQLAPETGASVVPGLSSCCPSGFALYTSGSLTPLGLCPCCALHLGFLSVSVWQGKTDIPPLYPSILVFPVLEHSTYCIRIACYPQCRPYS